MELADVVHAMPEELLRLGCESLEHIADLSFRPRRVDLLDLSIGDKFHNGEPEIDADIGGQRLEPIGLQPLCDGTPVFGVDTSSIELGETEDGVLFAVRGSVVLREGGSYRYIRHGPFAFHATDSNKQTLLNTLRRIYLRSPERAYAPSLEWVSGSVRSILERWLQRQVSESCEDSLLLWDGSLTAITAYSPLSFMNELLRITRNRGNYILAFSKKTRLSVSGRRVADLIDDRHVPCLVSIDEAIRSHYGSRLCFLGRVYAAKLAPGCFTFRLDIDRRVPEEEGVEAVQRLIGNDLVLESYPETLRLAHILARFSASEVIGMQRYVSENYGLRIVCRPDVRQALFGPYAGLSSRMDVSPYDAYL
ncbi:MAG: DNA double-strand break repair nuclease NurA [Candidatus Bathyarchaeia archaeon]